MMHFNIWRFNKLIGKLSFTTKKLQQIEVLLCGFHNKTYCSTTWKYTSLEATIKSLSHYWQCTFSTSEKLWDQKGNVFTLGKTSSTPLMHSMTQIMSSTIAKLQIARIHTWTLNLKMPFYLKSTWQKLELKFFKLHLNSIFNHNETRSFK
jgi:hypothetical protein